MPTHNAPIITIPRTQIALGLLCRTLLPAFLHFDRLADFDTILGAKECWGRGYGTEATRLTLEYGFTTLGLHNIMLTVRSYGDNPPAIHSGHT